MHFRITCKIRFLSPNLYLEIVKTPGERYLAAFLLDHAALAASKAGHEQNASYIMCSHVSYYW